MEGGQLKGLLALVACEPVTWETVEKKEMYPWILGELSIIIEFHF